MDSDDINSESGSDRPDPPNEIEQQVSEIADSLLINLRIGKSVDIDKLVEDNQHLQPHLEKRLRVVAAVFYAMLNPDRPKSGDETDSNRQRFSRSIRRGETRRHAETAKVNCPHCGNRIQIVSFAVQEVTCGSCGSSVLVDPEITRTDYSSLNRRKVGRYQSIRLLGQGSFGSVLLAHDPKLDRDVAVKIPRQGYFESLDEEVRFFREARSAAQLRHANIVQVFEVSEEADDPYIVSEFIDGLTLGDVASAGLRPFRWSVEMMIKIADAVHYAHQNGVIHRDLKPSNILVDQQQNPFVADFGLAKRDDGEITMTIDGTILGTPSYMSPEQASGIQGNVDVRSDVYSLGVILYKLLCRQLPFRGTRRMLIHQVVHEEPKSPRSFNEAIPKDLETITMKAMAKLPRERFQTAQEFSLELQRWLAGEPILSRPIPRITRLWRLGKKHPVVSLLTCAIALLLVLGTTGAIIWAVRESGLREVAKKNETVAKENRARSDSRLDQLMLRNGIQAMDDNDLSQSLFWFANRLTLSDSETRRIRIGLLQDRLPKLNRVWCFDEEVDRVMLCRDGSRFAASQNGQHIKIIDLTTGDIILDRELPPFRQFAVSADGRRLATFDDGENHLAVLWDVDGDERVQNLPHEDEVVSVDFDEVGEAMITGSFDGTATIWQSESGTMQSRRDFEFPVSRVQFVSNSDFAIVVSSTSNQAENKIHIWNYRDDRIEGFLLFPMHVISVATDSTANRLVAASEDGTLKLADLQGNVLKVYQESGSTVRKVFIDSRNGKPLIVFSNGSLQQWDSEGRFQVIAQLRSKAPLSAIELSTSNHFVGFGDYSGVAQFVSVPHGVVLTSALRNGERIQSIQCHPDGQRVVVSGQRGVIQLWDLAGSQPSERVLPHNGPVKNAVFTPDGLSSFSVANDEVIRWDTVTGQRIGESMKHAGEVMDCAIDVDGRLVATASVDKTVKLWQVADGSQFGSDLKHDSEVLRVAFDPTGRYLVSGCYDGSVSCWDLQTVQANDAEPLFTNQQDDKIRYVTFNDDGSLIASASMDGTVACMDSATGAVDSGPLSHDQQGVAFCQFIPNGFFEDSGNRQLLFTGAGGGLAFVWDIETGERVHQLVCNGEVTSAEISSELRQIVTCESTGKARIWRLENNRLVQHVEIQHPSADRIFFADVNPDSSLLALCGGRTHSYGTAPQFGTVLLWDLAEQQFVAPPFFHRGMVRRIQFSPNGEQILTASRDATARILTIPTSVLDQETLQRRASLYSQLEYGLGGAVQKMKPAEVRRRFEELSEAVPEYFLTQPLETENWKEKLERFAENGD